MSEHGNSLEYINGALVAPANSLPFITQPNLFFRLPKSSIIITKTRWFPVFLCVKCLTMSGGWLRSPAVCRTTYTIHFPCWTPRPPDHLSCVICYVLLCSGMFRSAKVLLEHSVPIWLHFINSKHTTLRAHTHKQTHTHTHTHLPCSH